MEYVYRLSFIHITLGKLEVCFKLLPYSRTKTQGIWPLYRTASDKGRFSYWFIHVAHVTLDTASLSKGLFPIDRGNWIKENILEYNFHLVTVSPKITKNINFRDYTQTSNIYIIT